MNYDAQTIKAAAAGRWPEILAALCGIAPDTFNGKHHPCPLCGGKDRFRFTNLDDNGSCYCNQCHNHDNGDGFAAIQWILKCDFLTALRLVAEYLGIGESSDGQKQSSEKSQIVATYDYRDEIATLLKQVCRKEPKGFVQRRPKPGGGWIWSVDGVRETPYRLPELLAAKVSDPVWIPEGEKDCNRLATLGCVAICNAGGTGKWSPGLGPHFTARHVVILPDNDTPGRQHAQQVAASLHGIAASVKVVELPGLPEKGDVSDWLDAGHTLDELWELAKATPQWTPPPAGEPLPEDWPQMCPFSDPELPEFPLETLSVLRPFVEELSRALQVSIGMVAQLVLAAISSTIARLVQVELRPGWIEPTNLFVVCIAEPGTRKSGTHAAVFAPIQALERERIEAAREEVARELCERRQAELRLKTLERKASEGDEVAQQEASEEAARLAQWPEPVLPRLICEDATEEALIPLLASQGGRILSTSTEGGVFSLMRGRYAKNGESQFDCYLKAHAGDPIIVDRISRGATSIERPAITIAYTVQPDVIQKASENESFRGRGAWARFEYHHGLTLVGQRQIAPPPVSSHVKQGYYNIIRHLAETAQELILRPDVDAAHVFLAWETEIERMLDSGGLMETMRDWGAKLAGATLRIAAALHCAEFGMAPTVARSTIESAIRIARYLIPHAEYVLNVLTTQEGAITCDAESLLRWLKRQGRPHFTQRDAHRSGGRRYRHVDEVIPALDELQRRGMIRPARGPDRSGPGRSPSPLFEVNPQLLSRSKYSKSADRIDRNPPPPSAAPNSVHSVNHFGMNVSQAPQSATEDWGTV